MVGSTDPRGTGEFIFLAEHLGYTEDPTISAEALGSSGAPDEA